MQKKSINSMRQSGVIPFLNMEGRIFIMLVSTKKGSRWIIPKGNIAKGYTERASAQKEALEEAGIKGTVSEKKAGVISFRKNTVPRLSRVSVYMMKIESIRKHWQESDNRKRKLFPIKDACRHVDSDDLKDLFKQMQHKKRIHA